MKDKRIGYSIFKWITLVICASAILIPFWLLAVSSLRQSTELLEYPPKFWPDNPTLNNYKQLFDTDKYQFIRWFLNSAIVAVASTLGTLFVCSLAAYAFGKKEFFGKNTLFTIALATMMIPSSVTLIPVFLIAKQLGLIDTLWGIFLPSLGSAFGVFLMRQFISTIPNSLIESARMDGCNEFILYLKIIVPVTVPSLAVLGIYTFMNQWNNLILPLILTNSEKMKTLPVAIAGLKSLNSSPWGIMMAASLLSFIPVLIVFLFAREKFIEGLTAGAVKG